MGEYVKDRQVWVGCLACYNAGELHGSGWVTPVDGDGWTCGKGTDYPHEEYVVMDNNGWLSGECSPGEALTVDGQWSDAESQLGEDQMPAFGAWVAEGLGDIDDVASFEDAYAGEWSGKQDFAQDLAEDIGALPHDYQWPTSCIDWEQATRELFYDYTAVDAPGGGVFVFHN